MIRLLLAGVMVSTMLSAAPVLAETLTLKPIDQAGRDPVFAAFRTKLLRAIARRDVDYVVAQASPEIKLSFGGEDGRDVFREALTGELDWQGEPYWAELQTVVELGGVFMSDGSFCTPYLACVDVPGCPDCDPFETVFVTGANVIARGMPDYGATEVARLSYDVLQIDLGSFAGEDWYSVKLPPGRIAYVPRADARMAIDYRARFERTVEGWRMTVFIAGD